MRRISISVFIGMAVLISFSVHAQTVTQSWVQQVDFNGGTAGLKMAKDNAGNLYLATSARSG